MNHTIAVLAGDGIGPEVMDQALKVLNKIEAKFNHNFDLKKGDIGGTAYEKYGNHLPQETIDLCENSEAILFGSVGGPVDAQHEEKWKGIEKNCLLGIRKHFDLFSNLRPAILYPSMSDLSTLRAEAIPTNGIDIMIVRELTGGIYFGEHKTIKNDEGKTAKDTMIYKSSEIERIIKVAIEIAKKRKKKITLVDKANVLDCSILWREVAKSLMENEKDIELEYMYVDNAAMQLVKNPSQFDLIVTANMFGDILSDLASTFAGSIGLSPSASLNSKGFGLYEPIGGSAQDIAGKNFANPIAQILSASMMLKYSFNMIEESNCIDKAVQKALSDNYRTGDIMQNSCQKVGTSEMGDLIISNI